LSPVELRKLQQRLRRKLIHYQDQALSRARLSITLAG